MKSEAQLKNEVREKYSALATNESAACCGSTSTTGELCNIMADDYESVEGYQSVADLGLGCGLPTQFARISKGDTVIDLGSGAGNDCFIARHEVGAEGKVIGIDFTPAMIQKARANAEKLGFNNVEFREGDIENMPLSDDMADVVVSNCVLNLVPNKPAVLKEIFRVLKPGGHFSISDIVIVGALPAALQEDAEMYAGCVSGAIDKLLYLEQIKNAGFENLTLQKEKPIELPDSILEKYLDKDGIRQFREGTVGIFSISVYAEKPGFLSLGDSGAACGPDSTCC